MRCDCEECRRRWIADLVSYAVTLEGEILSAHASLKKGEFAAAYGILYALQEIVRERDLTAELNEEAAAWNERVAAELREAGRLH